ncbi:MAG: hypothetical protein MJ150_00195 [Clostridia bacterium]|nr:hypothetical protein [Clostridia bacterium]
MKSRLYKLIKAIAFLVILVMLFISCSYILRPADDRRDNYANFYNEPKNTIDVVFVGSSPIYPYFAPTWLWHEYGFTSSMLSSSIQPPDAMLPLIKDAMKTQSPKLLVLELRLFVHDADAFHTEANEFWNRTTVDNMKYSLNRASYVLSFAKQRTEGGPVLEDFVDVVRYHGNWKTLTKENFAYYNFEKNSSIKGYWFNPNIEVQDYTPVTDINEVGEIYPLRETQLREICLYCQENKVQPLFLFTPHTTKPDQKLMYNRMTEIVNEYGFEVLNMNNHLDEIGIDFKEDFYNGGHVNTHGSTKVMKYFGEYLKNNYPEVFTTHDDKTSKNWDDDYLVWKEIYDENMATWEANQKALKGGQ